MAIITAIARETTLRVSARYTTAERSEDVVYDSYFTRSTPYSTRSIPYSMRRSRVEYGMDRVEYGVDRVKYEKNQTRRHPRDKTHPRVAAPHIPWGIAEWNMSLILFIYHVSSWVWQVVYQNYTMMQNAIFNWVNCQRRKLTLGYIFKKSQFCRHFKEGILLPSVWRSNGCLWSWWI